MEKHFLFFIFGFYVRFSKLSIAVKNSQENQLIRLKSLFWFMIVVFSSWTVGPAVFGLWCYSTVWQQWISEGLVNLMASRQGKRREEDPGSQ
jgi:hypothetical protein